MTGRGSFWPRVARLGPSTSTGLADDKADRFRRAILPHLDAAYNLARYLAKDSYVAEDIVQEAFLRAYRGFDGWRGETPKAWLLAIVRNCFLDRVADTARMPSSQSLDEWSDDLPPQLIEPASPESMLMEKNEAAMLRATIEQLPEPFRATLVLRELEELSYKEIAAVTHAPVGTVMSRLARARQMLAELLVSDISREAQA